MEATNYPRRCASSDNESDMGLQLAINHVVLRSLDPPGAQAVIHNTGLTLPLTEKLNSLPLPTRIPLPPSPRTLPPSLPTPSLLPSFSVTTLTTLNSILPYHETGRFTINRVSYNERSELCVDKRYNRVSRPHHHHHHHLLLLLLHDLDDDHHDTCMFTPFRIITLNNFILSLQLCSLMFI